MLEFMLDLLPTLVTALGFAAIGHSIGTASANRKHHVRNAATARCVGCEWSSGPVTLSEAFAAGERHTDSEQHRALVVRA